jgi:hypothetical protein
MPQAFVILQLDDGLTQLWPVGQSSRANDERRGHEHSLLQLPRYLRHKVAFESQRLQRMMGRLIALPVVAGYQAAQEALRQQQHRDAGAGFPVSRHSTRRGSGAQ